MFARGSGQTLNFREAPRFFEKVTNRLDGIGVNAYELGAEAHDGAQYPAYGIGFDSLQSFKNLIEADASWTGPAGGEYRSSVTSGVTELTAYLTARAARCPDEIFAIGGYSQGAQVVGDALPNLSASTRDRIAYVALFGDPKLYLPEGRGPFPPACIGKQFSEWRRGNVSCFTDNGILEARKPYLPSDVESRSGSWCDRNDPICNNNPADFVVSAHSFYADDGAEMDEAAREVAIAIADRLPPEQAETIDISIFVLAAGANGIDVAFVIDTTGSMSGQIGAATSVADLVGTNIINLRGRVALTEYRDAFDSFVAEVRTPLTTDVGLFRSSLDDLFASGGGDSPEALLTALMTTFDALDWTPGATKAAVVLTDAGYHDPDVANGWTAADVVQRSLEIDPVNVYPVVPAYLESTYQPLADATAGQVIIDSGDTAAALVEAFEAVSTRPVVVLPFDQYFAAPGDEVVFEVFAYDIDADIVGYEWDFDADGVIDLATEGPTATHVYATPFSGIFEVRATSADGGIGSAAGTIEVSESGLADRLPGPATGLAAELVDEANRSFRVSWDAVTDPDVDGWALLNGDGDLLARLAPEITEIVIPGVPDEGGTVSLVAFNEFGSSDVRSVELPSALGDPLSALQRLRDDVAGAGLARGLERSLLAKVEAAIRSVEHDRMNPACGQVGALANQLGSSAARDGIDSATLADWSARANSIRELLDCG
ncbi:MAG: cutinase family protein [Ilumatobacter sp.]|nr:cutinase family protein [Ilumatobacter sp.]